MAEAIKKIAGDANFTNNPSRTLKTVMDTINGLGSTYYKRLIQSRKQRMQHAQTQQHAQQRQIVLQTLQMLRIACVKLATL